MSVTPSKPRPPGSPAPPAAAKPASEKDAKQLSAGQPIDEAEVKGLLAILPTEFDVEVPKAGKQHKGKAELVRDLFLSDKEYQEVARQVICKAVKKFTPGMDPKAKIDIVTADLRKLINRRYEAKERLAHRVQRDGKMDAEKPGSDHPGYARYIEEGFPTNLKAMIKAEEIFASSNQPFNTVEFAGEKAGEAFIAHHNRGEVRVYRVQKVLAQGGSSVVFKVMNIANGKFEAMKLSKVVPSVQQHEARARQVHHFTKGAARASVDASQTTLLVGQNILGYIMPLRDIDLIEAGKHDYYKGFLTHPARQRFVGQVVEQQFHLQRNKRFNFDLKPNNIMLTVKPLMFQSEGDRKESSASQRTSVALVDLDDAIDLTILNEEGVVDPAKLQSVMHEIRTGVIRTPAFTSITDEEIFIGLTKEARNTLPHNFTSATSPQDITRTLDFLRRYKEAAQKRNIFTLGATCFYMLTEKMPYVTSPFPETHDDPNRPNPIFTKHLTDLGYSEDLAAFLARMMSHNPADRPSQQEVEDKFKGFKFLSQEDIDRVRYILYEDKVEADYNKLIKPLKLTLSEVQKSIEEQKLLLEKAKKEGKPTQVIEMGLSVLYLRQKTIKDYQLIQLKKEAEALALVKAGYTLEKLDTEIEKNKALHAAGKMSDADLKGLIAFFERFKGLLQELPGLQKANREIADFNPFLALYSYNPL